MKPTDEQVEALIAGPWRDCHALARAGWHAGVIAALTAERDRHWSEFQDACSTGSHPDPDLARFHGCELNRLDDEIAKLEGNDDQG